MPDSPVGLERDLFSELSLRFFIEIFVRLMMDLLSWMMYVNGTEIETY